MPDKRAGDKIKVCITGSGGFIGSALMGHLQHNEELELVPFVGDLLKEEDVTAFFEKNKNIDQIVHLVGAFSGSFEALVKINCVALENCLEGAVKNGVKKVIYASSGAVYGEPVGEESTETDPLSPNTLYGLSKKYGEDCLRYYSQNHKIQSIVLRFPNVYGLGNNKGVIYNFLSAIKTSGKIDISGDGTQTRNFLHVSDACRAIEQSIGYQQSEIFNISNPEKVSINDLIQMLRENNVFTVEHKEQDNNLKDLLLNTNKAKKLLKYSPRVNKVTFDL